MLGLPLLVLIVVFVLLVLGKRSKDTGLVPRPGARPVARSEPVGADELLHRAVDEGVLTKDQADTVLALSRPAEAPAGAEARPARVPPVLEALGYLGAVLIMVGAVSLVARFWDDIARWGRLAILGATAAALTGAGLAIRDEEEPVLWRLRSVLLLLATGATAGFTGLLVVDALDIKDQPAVILIGGAVALHSGLLWWRQDRPAQHLGCAAGLAMMLGGAVSWLGGEGGAIGLSLWAAGALWLLASRRRLLPPELVGMLLGAVTTLVGAAVVTGEWRHFGALFGLATAAALITWGVRTEAFLLTAIGVLGSFGFLPATVNIYFKGTIGVPAVMLVSGAALLGLTAWLLQHRAPPPRAHPA